MANLYGIRGRQLMANIKNIELSVQDVGCYHLEVSALYHQTLWSKSELHFWEAHCILSTAWNYPHGAYKADLHGLKPSGPRSRVMARTWSGIIVSALLAARY